MAVGFDRVARSKKARGGVRALLGGKAPAADEVGERLARLAKRALKKAVIDATPRRVTFKLHPFASPTRIVVLPDGGLEVKGDTSALGPGYHAEIAARLAPILDELDFAWLEEDPPFDVAGEHLAWLARRLAVDGPVRIAMPGGKTFATDAPVLTALGPRDAAWRAAVIADPTRGRDAFAWWGTGPGVEARSRALLAMWHEVPWRRPIDEDETALLQRVHGWLAAAHAADPELVLPWADWCSLVDALDLDDDLAERVRARGGKELPTIGYRRLDVEVELSGGWTVRLPGALVGGWEDDETRYVATDGFRALEFTTLTADPGLDSAALLAVAPEAHPVIARRSEGTLRGRAEGRDEDGVRVVHAIVVDAPHLAIVTCKGDEAWALATFQSISRT